MRRTRLGLLALALLGCGDDPAGQPSVRTLYSASVRRVVFEVDYAAGAEPYTDLNAWGVFRANVTRLFQGADKTFEIPTTLSQMQRIDASGDEFTSSRILDVSRANRQQLATGGTATFHFLWLNGYYHDGTARRADVLGVSIGTTGVVAIFKPVVVSTGQGSLPYVARVIEQSTLVHEFGHAAGLVANGVPATTAHHDSAHGAHCTNERCVMNYSNEGASAARAFVLRFMATGDTILYDQACLDDAQAFIAAGR